MAKFREYYKLMLDNNKELFRSFREVHDKYVENPDRWRDKFNQLGFEVQDVMRVWENRLCGRSESSGYGMYSSRLAEKFRGEIRKNFPKIDEVGLVVHEEIKLKKINLD